MSKAQWYFLTADQQRHGPVSISQLTDAYQNGQVSLDSLVWRTDQANWQPMRYFAAQLKLESEEVDGSPVALSTPNTFSSSAKLQKKSRKILLNLACLGVIYPFSLLGMHRFYMRSWGWGLVNLLFFAFAGLCLEAARSLRHLYFAAQYLNQSVFKAEGYYFFTEDGPGYKHIYLIHTLEATFGLLIVALSVAALIDAIRIFRMSPAQFQARLKTFKSGPLGWF